MLQKLVGLFARGGANKRGGFSLDGMLERMDRHLDHFTTLVRPTPESSPRTPFDTDLPPEQISTQNFTFRQILKMIPEMVPLLIGMQRSARMYDGRFQPTKKEASPGFIAQLEALARAAGAKDIGYVKVPRNAIFRDKGIPHEYAIVFTVEMDQVPIETAPSFACMHEVAHGYKNLAAISNKLAGFMRQHGFAAYPGTALGGLTDYPHLAELAGLGAIGYHGLLIAPGEGARLRINTIYTNITNLPTLQAQGTPNEHLWVRDFCAMCKKCVRTCPVNAIYEQPQPRGDGGMQIIEPATCRDYFTQNYGCGVCLAVCPFSHSGYEKVQAKFKGNPNAPQFRIEPAA
ncbi:MAG: 4Fe-4S binding protein [Herpetosiphonaceae bacterium]|nr:4Fe-4S binding protein [Herpetosiphonaceae bacterium]